MTRSSGTLRSARSVSLATMCSRVLGLVRDIATVAVFPKAVSDAVVLAWTIPNLFRRLFGEGALSAATTPVLARVESERGRNAMASVASSVATALVVVLVPLSGALIAATFWIPESWWIDLFDSPEKGRTTVRLMSWMLPYLVLICVAAQLQSIANLQGRFFVPAMAPALLNLAWVAGVAVAAWTATDAPHPEWIAAAVAVGGVLQVLLQWGELRRVGVHVGLAPIWTPEVKAIAVAAVPLFLGMAANQLNLLIDRSVAEGFVGAGAVTNLFLGNRLIQLPLGLVGVAMGTALFPAIARAGAAGDDRRLATELADALRFTLMLALPALVGLVVLAAPIISLLFVQGGEFGAADVPDAAWCMVGYAGTILGQSFVLLIARAEYARRRHRRVVRLGLIAVAVNIALDFLLVQWLAAPGLALATTLATLVNATLLSVGFGLWRETDVLRPLVLSTVRSLAAAGVMGGVVHASRVMLESLAPPGFDAWCVGGGISIGVLAYAAALRLLSPAEFRELIRLLPGRRRG